MTWVIEVGQVYESTDPREEGRQVRVTRIGEFGAEVVNTVSGRKGYIQLTRLQPAGGPTLSKRGYRLVSDE